MSAGEHLQAAVADALREIEGLGIYEGAPLQAVVPHPALRSDGRLPRTL